MDQLKTSSLLSLNETLAQEYLSQFEYPYEALSGIKDYIIKKISFLNKDDYNIKGDIAIAKSAKIHPSAVINGPAIIGLDTEIRPNAFIRGSVIIGSNCVIGNSCEFKNVIIFNNAQIPHFNYVGDSIIGYQSHLSAGVITSNLKSDKTNINIKINDEIINTNLRKMGAIVGDNVEVGCNSVLNPGTIIGKNTSIYPLSSVRGYISENSIYKDKDNVVQKES